MFIIVFLTKSTVVKDFWRIVLFYWPGLSFDKDKVKAQYQNLVEKGDDFDYEFYVPENVYIIGMMSDIDSIVESMDFAFRRRNSIFEFKNLIVF